MKRSTVSASLNSSWNSWPSSFWRHMRVERPTLLSTLEKGGREEQ